MSWQQPTVVVSGGANHALHAVLTLLTCGMWLPVWILAAIVQRPQRVSVPHAQQPWPQQQNWQVHQPAAVVPLPLPAWMTTPPEPPVPGPILEPEPEPYPHGERT